MYTCIHPELDEQCTYVLVSLKGFCAEFGFSAVAVAVDVTMVVDCGSHHPTIFPAAFLLQATGAYQLPRMP